jgi:hypothetical protein
MNLHNLLNSATEFEHSKAQYFTVFVKDKDLFLHCRFRICNHRISIDIGRWQNINRENRVCNLCQGMKLGDEFNYLLFPKGSKQINIKSMVT